MKKSIFTVALLVFVSLAATAQSTENKDNGRGKPRNDGGERSSSVPNNHGQEVSQQKKGEAAVRKEEKSNAKKEEKVSPKKDSKPRKEGAPKNSDVPAEKAN